MSITVRRGIIITLGDKAEIVIEESSPDGYKIDIIAHVEHKLWIAMPHKDGKHYPFWDDVVNTYSGSKETKEQMKSVGV